MNVLTTIMTLSVYTYYTHKIQLQLCPLIYRDHTALTAAHMPMFFTLRYMRPANTLAVSTCTEPLQLLSALLACTPQQQPSSPCNGKGKYISYIHVTSFLIVTCWSVGGREGVRKGVREGDKETLSFATQLPLEATHEESVLLNLLY